MSSSHPSNQEFPTQRTNWWSFLTTVRVNPLNLKCETLPILSLRNQYSRNFHLSWLGFWVAFLSWFAFSPLVPEAVSQDLKLTPSQLGNSNVISLCATLIVRLIAGPLVDLFGPRKVMAGLLILGAVPSGLAGLVRSAEGLYAVRFFIGILGGTFVPCQAWTTVFFDKKVVGGANALAAGWGNSGGGFTFIIMVALYNQLRHDGLTSHTAWRAAFAIVPVPILLFTAILIMVFGTDHPAGKWADRHSILAARIDEENSHRSEGIILVEQSEKKEFGSAVEKGPDFHTPSILQASGDLSGVDAAVNRSPTWHTTSRLLCSQLTWLPMMAYFSTFGFELAVDANLSNVLYQLYKGANFDQAKAGYIASIFGLLNIFARPAGGYAADLLYKRFGVPGKKYLMLSCGLLQGVFTIALGFYILNQSQPSLAVVIGLVIIVAIFNEAANGANFAIVPHCNPNLNGVMSGLVGGCANLGGVIFTIIFRLQPTPIGKAIWICGVLATALNIVLVPISVPEV